MSVPAFPRPWQALAVDGTDVDVITMISNPVFLPSRRAKMKGFSPWPGKVRATQGSTPSQLHVRPAPLPLPPLGPAVHPGGTCRGQGDRLRRFGYWVRETGPGPQGFGVRGTG